jgi:hypothetical protein
MMITDPLLDTKIEDVTSGLIPYFSSLLHGVSLSIKENALTNGNVFFAIETKILLMKGFLFFLLCPSHWLFDQRIILMRSRGNFTLTKPLHY